MRGVHWRERAPRTVRETLVLPKRPGAVGGRAAGFWLRSALLLLMAGVSAKLLGFGGAAAAAAFLAWSILLVAGVRLVIRLLEEHLPPIA